MAASPAECQHRARGAGGAHELVLDIGDAQFVGPAVGLIRHNAEMAAAVCRTPASLIFPEIDLLRAASDKSLLRGPPRK